MKPPERRQVTLDDARRAANEYVETMSRSPRITVYRDRKKLWRWRLDHKNGRITADGGQSFKTLSRCRASVSTLLESIRAFVLDERHVDDLIVVEESKR